MTTGIQYIDQSKKARAALIRRRDDLLARERFETAELTQTREQVVQDLGAQAADMWSFDTLTTIKEAVHKELQAIDAALDRINHEQYGLCVQCGKGIDPNRLRAVLHAARCRACADSN